jgi:hypothetical protein
MRSDQRALTSRGARGKQRPARRRVRVADAPVKSTRQAAALLPVSSELEADLDLARVLDGDASPHDRERFEQTLRTQLLSVLADHDVAARVELAIDGARVELHGWVPDVLTLQLVEDLAWTVQAVRQCDNRLRVAQ